MKESKCILLDRDGVINFDRPESVTKINSFVPIDSSLEAIRLLHEANFKIIVITNQACVGRGDLSIKMLNKIHELLQKKLDYKIHDFFICTHTDEDNCNCRKPKPGLIFEAQKKWGFKMRETFLVGDAQRDIQAAHNAGCKPVIVETGKITRETKDLPKVPIFKDLLDFTYQLI